MELLQPQKGHLLVAEIALTGDASFGRSVVYIAEHDVVTGTVGFVLNKKIDLQLSDLIPGIKLDFDIYSGGPVETQNLYFLHTIPDLLPSSLEISNGVFWGGDFDRLKEKLKKGEVPPEKIKFFLGYSGWHPQQLEDEIALKSWIVCRNKWDIFKENDASTWKNKLINFGGEYMIWANSPKNPSHN